MAQSNVIRGAFKDPSTKADLIDRMMRRDFDGDLASLAVDRDLKMERVRPHVLRLKFGKSGKEYDLTVHKSRPPNTGGKKKAGPPKRKAAASAPQEQQQQAAAPGRKRRGGGAGEGAPGSNASH